MTYKPFVAWAAIHDVPSEFPPEAHGHAVGDVANLATDLASKAAAADLSAHTGATVAAHGGIVATTDARLSDARDPLAHGHVEGDVTGLVADLGATEKTANKGAPGGYAALNTSGYVPSTQLQPPA